MDITYQDILEAFDDVQVLRRHKVYHRRVLFEHDKEFQMLSTNRDYLHALVFKDKFLAFYKLNYYKLDNDKVVRVKDTPFPKKMREELGLYYLLKLDRLPPRDMEHKGKKMLFHGSTLIWNVDNLEMLCVEYR